MITSIGIDTLHLQLSRELFSFNKDRVDRQSLYSHSIGSDNDYISNRYHLECDGIKVSINSQGLLLTISCPILAGRDNNAIPASHTDLLICEKRLEEFLSTHEIECGPVRNLNIKRIDIPRDIVTEFSFPAYRNTLSTLSFSRMSYICCPNSYTLQNKYHAISFYGKSEQLRIKGFPVSEHIMRVEVRLLRKSAVKRNGLGTFGSLLDNYNLVENIYFRYLKSIFSSDIQPQPSGSDWRLDILFKYPLKTAKNALVASVLSDIPLDVLRSALERSVKFQRANQITKEFSDLLKQGIYVQGEFPSLYQELKTKFLYKQEPILRW